MTEAKHEGSSDHLRQAAAAALSDVDALAVTGEDRKIVLRALLQARLGGFNPPAVQFPAKNGGGTPTAEPMGAAPGSEGDVLDRIGTALKVDRDTLELVYALQDGEPHLVVSPKRIAGNKAQATRQLGQLLATARQLGGLEEWTTAPTIRKVAQDYGRLDSANFAANLQQMDSVAVIRGKGQQREVKITKPGLEATADLIRSIVGSDS